MPVVGIIYSLILAGRSSNLRPSVLAASWANEAPSLLKLHVNRYSIGLLALIWCMASRPTLVARPLWRYSGSTSAEHKYMASYFMFTGVLFNSSVSEISPLINWFIRLMVVGISNIQTTGPAPSS